MRYDAQLTLFRSGVFACFVWSLFTATSFHLPSSLTAVLMNNPTTEELATQATALAKHQTECVKTSWKGPKQEFPVSCLADTAPLVAMPRDRAWQNLRLFFASSMLLIVGVTLVSWLGVRMARESETLPVAGKQGEP